MGKDFKEKYERVCAVKDRAIGLVEAQINGNIENVDAKELGEVADIAKDFAEIMKLCCEAEYYHSITQAMEDSSKDDKKFYMDKYLPETQMYYTPIGNYARQRDSRGRYMYTEPNMMYDDRFDDSFRDRMYYSSGGNSNGGNSGSKSSGSRTNMNMNDSRYGQSYISRRGYMEAREKGDDSKKTEELEKYMHDLAEDLTEMFESLSSSEKTSAKQKLSQLVSKM